MPITNQKLMTVATERCEFVVNHMQQLHRYELSGVLFFGNVLISILRSIFILKQ